MTAPGARGRARGHPRLPCPRARRGRPAPAQDLAELADLLRVALASGFTVLRAVALVAAHLDTPTAAAFGRAVGDPAGGPNADGGAEARAEEDAGAAFRAGGPTGPGAASPVDALAALPDELGDAARDLCGALVAAARDGAPVGAALERVAFELRLTRRLEAETRARRTSVLLLFPLVLCVLPAFVLLAVVPLLLAALAALPGGAP